LHTGIDLISLGDQIKQIETDKKARTQKATNAAL
jgi:hypothetical protein